MKNSINPPTNTSNNPQKHAKIKRHPFWRWFWLSFLVFSLAYAWHSFYVPSNDVVWAENIDSAKELASDSDKNILLFFTADWCVPCRIMKREVFADKHVMKTIHSQVVPVIININDPNAEELVKQYNVDMTPITIFTDSQGKVLNYALGKIGKTKFLEMLENLGTEDI